MRLITTIILSIFSLLTFELFASENSETHEIIFDKYHIDSIDHIYVQQPRVALERMDTLRLRCEARNWVDCPRSRLEMVTALIYLYLEDQTNSLRHCYAVLEHSQGETKDDVWWSLMAYQYISTIYLSNEDWNSLAKSVENMEYIALNNKQYSWTTWYQSLSMMMKAEVMASQNHLDDAVALINSSRKLMSGDGIDYSTRCHNLMETTAMLARLYAKAGKYEQSLKEYENLLHSIDNECAKYTDGNLDNLTRLRSFSSMSHCYYELGDSVSAARYYNMAKELRKKYNEGYGVVEPMAKYLCRSEQYQELDSLMLPLFEHALEGNIQTKQIESYMNIYITSLRQRGLSDLEVMWTRRYIELQDALAKERLTSAYDSFAIALKSYEQEKQLAEVEVTRYRSKMSITLLIIFSIILLIAATITTLLWRKQQRDNKFLFQQAQELNTSSQRLTQRITEQTAPQIATGVLDPIDQRLHNKIHSFLVDKSTFLDPTLTTKSVQEHIGITYDALNRHMLTLFGMSCTEYILRLRLEYSCRLLSTTNMTIDAVADSSGFSSSRTFYRQFKDKYNISPTEYRKIYIDTNA